MGSQGGGGVGQAMIGSPGGQWDTFASPGAVGIVPVVLVLHQCLAHSPEIGPAGLLRE